jgi:hypothetical protein
MSNSVDYNDYMVRTYISQSFENERQTTNDNEHRKILNETEDYLLDLYDAGLVNASWDRDDGAPTLTMRRQDPATWMTPLEAN